MSLQKYLTRISSVSPGKIYVENVRSFLKVSSHKARVFCEMAVKESLFIRKIGIECPNDGRVIEEFQSESEIPSEITCDVCEDEGRDDCTFKTSNLKRIVYYKLSDE